MKLHAALSPPRFLHTPAEKLWPGVYRALQSSTALGLSLLQRGARKVHGLPLQALPSKQALRELGQRYEDLLCAEVESVRAGDYPKDLLFRFGWLRHLPRWPSLALEIHRILERQSRKAHAELPARVDLSAYPPYYRRNFHWQSDGYLSERSAELYDAAVEFLFTGTANVMRRRALAKVATELRDRPKTAPRARLLDVGCGTGEFLAQLSAACPQVEATGIDLSPFYLKRAERRSLPVEWVQGRAEALPFEDGHFDLLSSIFMFHELPRRVRREALREFYRVLRPGGLLVLQDAAQVDDAGELAFFLERFPEEFHEPFFSDYLRDPLEALLTREGFVEVQRSDAFVSKVVVARKP